MHVWATNFNCVAASIVREGEHQPLVLEGNAEVGYDARTAQYAVNAVDNVICCIDVFLEPADKVFDVRLAGTSHRVVGSVAVSLAILADNNCG